MRPHRADENVSKEWRNVMTIIFMDKDMVRGALVQLPVIFFAHMAARGAWYARYA